MNIKNIGRLFFESVDLGGGGGGGAEADPIRDAITSSIAGSEQGDGGVVEERAPVVDPAAEAEEKELKALEDEIRGKNPTMKGQIAVHRHQAVLTRQRNLEAKAREEWAAKEKAWQEREAAIAAQEAEWKQYEWAKDPEIQEALQAIALAETDQEKFVELLLQDERFAKLISRKEAESMRSQGLVPSDRPRPNQRTEDGSLEYYDDQGLEQLLSWHGKQVSEATKADVLKAVEQKYGPLADAYESSTKWSDARSRALADIERMKAESGPGQRWDGFAENMKEIKTLMNQKGNEKMDVREAYQIVMIPKLRAREKELLASQAANKEALRKELIEEMRKKPAAADAVVKSGGIERAGESAESDDLIGDAIRRSIRNMNT